MVECDKGWSSRDGSYGTEEGADGIGGVFYHGCSCCARRDEETTMLRRFSLAPSEGRISSDCVVCAEVTIPCRCVSLCTTIEMIIQ